MNQSAKSMFLLLFAGASLFHAEFVPLMRAGLTKIIEEILKEVRCVD